MNMFFYSLMLIALPRKWFLWLGRPFRYNERRTLDSYNEQFTGFYLEKFFVTITVLGGLAILCLLGYSAPIILGILLLVLGTIDLLLGLSRVYWAQEQIKEAKGRNEIVPIGFWQDHTIQDTDEWKAQEKRRQGNTAHMGTTW